MDGLRHALEKDVARLGVGQGMSGLWTALARFAVVVLAVFVATLTTVGAWARWERRRRCPQPVDARTPPIPVLQCSDWPLPKHTAVTMTPEPARPLYAVTFRGGLGTRVAISSQIAAQDFYAHERDLDRPRDFGFGWPLEAVLGHSLFVQTGEAHKALHRAVKDPFWGLEHLGAGALITQRVVQDFVRDLTAEAQRVPAGAALVLDSDRLLQPPFVAVVRLLYGSSLSDKHMQRLELFRQEMDAITMGAFSAWGALPVLRHLPSPLARRINRFRREWREFHQALLAEEHAAGTEPSFVNKLAAQVAAGQLSEDQMLDTLNEIVLANADFVAAAVAWPLVFLARYRQTLAGVRAECSTALPTEDGPALLTALRRMSLLDAVLEESWRLEPMLFVTNPVLPRHDIDVAGYRIRRGTPVVVDAKAVNRDPAIWGPTANAFNPSRFLPGAPKPPRYSLQVFGLGSRKCLGQELAKITVKLMLIHLLNRFDVTAVLRLPQKKSYGPFEFPPDDLLLTLRP